MINSIAFIKVRKIFKEIFKKMIVWQGQFLLGLLQEIQIF